MIKKRPKRTLILGPVPPPYGGATVSFQRFLEYVKELSSETIDFQQFPAITKRNGTAKVSKFRSLLLFIPILLRTRHYERVILFSSQGTGAIFAPVLARVCAFFGIPFFLRFFGGYPFQRIQRFPSLFRRWVIRQLGRSRTIILQAETGKSEAPSELLKLIKVIPGYRPLVDCKTDYRREPDSPFRFAYTGSCSAEKGIDTLVRVFSEIHLNHTATAELHLFGPDKLDLASRDKGANGIFWHGMVPHHEICRQLKGLDCFVFPSRYLNEGHPGSVIEAMMAGLPTVCTDLPTVMEIVKHKHNGLVVAVDSANDLEEAMLLVAQQPELSEELGREARKTGMQHDEELLLPPLARLLELIP